MGACLSCLVGDDLDYNERASLLGNQETITDDDFQEDLIKQQQRQNELNTIVNDLSDNLIDVATFLSRKSAENGHVVTQGTQSLENSTRSLIPRGDDDLGDSEAGLASSVDGMKQYPSLWSLDKKVQLMKDVATSHATFEIKPSSESLYVVF